VWFIIPLTISFFLIKFFQINLLLATWHDIYGFHPNFPKKALRALIDGQKPWITSLGCISVLHVAVKQKDFGHRWGKGKGKWLDFYNVTYFFHWLFIVIYFYMILNVDIEIKFFPGTIYLP
jgi:hypothetical protein